MPFRALLLGILIAGPLAARSADSAGSPPLDPVLSMIASGRRGEARVVLDSLLAAGALQDSDRGEATYQRAMLEEDGASFEERVTALLASGAAPAREGRLHLALGQLAYARGDLEAALASFVAAKEHGLAEEGSLWQGLSALALGDGPAAREALDRAAGSGNSAIRQRARLALGDAQRLSGNWEAAIREYRRVRDDERKGPGWWPTAAYHEADCLETLGKQEEAIRLLLEILEQWPTSYEAPLAAIRLRALSDLVVAEEEEEKEEKAEEPEETPEKSPVALPDSTAESPASGALHATYTIQVGAFSVKENAEGLAGDLTRRGVDARVDTRDDGLFRVLVGRYSGREAAESAGDSLGAAYGLGFTVLPLEEE